MKKIIGLIMALIMVSSMFAVTAFAEGKTYVVNHDEATVFDPTETLPTGCEINQIYGFKMTATCTSTTDEYCSFLIAFAFKTFTKDNYNKGDMKEINAFYQDNVSCEFFAKICKGTKLATNFSKEGDTQPFEYKSDSPIFSKESKMSLYESFGATIVTLSDIKWLDKDGKELKAVGGDTTQPDQSGTPSGGDKTPEPKTSTPGVSTNNPSSDASEPASSDESTDSTDSTISENDTANLTSSLTSELVSTTQASGKESKNNSKVIAIVVIVAVVIIGAGVASFFIIRKKKGSAE